MNLGLPNAIAYYHIKRFWNEFVYCLSCWERLRAGVEGDDRGSFDWHESGQTLKDSLGQGSLVCCSPCGGKESAWLSSWVSISRYPPSKNFTWLSEPLVSWRIFWNVSSHGPWGVSSLFYVEILESLSYRYACWVASITSDSLRPYGLQLATLLCP